MMAWTVNISPRVITEINSPQQTQEQLCNAVYRKGTIWVSHLECNSAIHVRPVLRVCLTALYNNDALALILYDFGTKYAFYYSNHCRTQTLNLIIRKVTRKWTEKDKKDRRKLKERNKRKKEKERTKKETLKERKKERKKKGEKNKKRKKKNIIFISGPDAQHYYTGNPTTIKILRQYTEKVKHGCSPQRA